MARFLTLAMVALAAAVPPAADRSQQPEQQQPGFRGATDTVRVFVTVTDRDGRLVTTLTKDQFEVRDDGKPQPIAVFDNSPEPIQLIVMLDVSGSMAGNLTLLRESSQELFHNLAGSDVARLGTFGQEIVISPEFTRDVRALEEALPEQIPPNAPTPLWRAMDSAMSAFDPKSDRRKVVLVLSDGKDEDMGFHRHIATQVDVIDRARAEDVMIYAVGLRSRSQTMPRGMGPGGLQAMMTANLPDPGLARTAEETGGGYAEVTLRDDLGAAFAEIARELHSQYLLGYAPPKRDGKTHKIDVRVTAHGLSTRARRSYMAPK